MYTRYIPSDFNANFAIFVILIWWLLLFVYFRDRNVVKFKVIFLLNGSSLRFRPHIWSHTMKRLLSASVLCCVDYGCDTISWLVFLWVYCVTISVLNFLLIGISHEAFNFYVQDIMGLFWYDIFWNKYYLHNVAYSFYHIKKRLL